MNSAPTKAADKREAAPTATEMSAQEWREHRYQCPLEAALDIIGGRWKGTILYHLSGRPQRFNELRRTFPGLSQRSLTTQLRELERDGVIARTVYAQVPHMHRCHCASNTRSPSEAKSWCRSCAA